MSLQLLVAIYKRDRYATYPVPYAYYEHFALYIDDGPKSIVFELDGCPPHSIRPSMSIRRPEHNCFRRYLENRYVGEICMDDIGKIRELISNVRVKSRPKGRDCQNYVLDMMNALVEGGVLEDTPDFYSVVEELIARREDR
ncbi:hypothetical protein N7492_003145 [Penicillium capsulatum]|uniref:Uncharacterized protein n=1 Tax=Penicillium capsulatum TaxID=69766 RepID=A0A9W9LWB7_9EURO|nr:hypothetical protein N7492_003145 [Penicillium capsulatum]KAJ6122265.1 hypothetical protein N7512_004730 [Penicillium capsulatum]